MLPVSKERFKDYDTCLYGRQICSDQSAEKTDDHQSGFQSSPMKSEDYQ